MSSNDHKTFKTDAAQKASTDTEIISDAIILPPYSTDHVLTVTAPSSTSNLTGQVDVELEMSPDGENWCALQTEETITTQGGGTSTPGANVGDANLKAVSTVPDITHSIGQYKNKFALGNLAYDDSGNETAVNQGSKDFMHQFISKDKPFNYSLWYKTDTNTQAFGDDYTPVLFRHGGKDKFTNSNVVQLTATGAAVGAQNNYYALRTSTSGSSDIYVPKVTSVGIYGNQGTRQNITGGRDFTTTFWVYIDSAYISSSNKDFGIAGQGIDAPTQIYFTLSIGTATNGDFLARVLFNAGNALTGVPAAASPIVMSNPNNISFSNGWYLYSVSNDAAHLKLHYRIINQSGQLFREAYMTYNTFYNFDTAYASGLLHSNQPQYAFVGQNTAVYPSVPNFIQDEFGTYDTYLSTSDLQKLTNGTTAVHPLNAGLSPTSYFRFGDVPGDSIANNTYIGNLNCDVGSISQMKSYRSPPTATTGMYTYQYDPVTYPHHAFMNYTPTGSKGTQNLCEPVALPLSSVFTSTSSFSISGWFKTTDIGILFSNGPLASLAGLNLAITNSTNIDLKLGVSTPTSITSSIPLNNDQWHHLLLTKSNSGVYTVYVDSVSMGTVTDASTDPKGSYGFTLLGNGQNNANATTSPSSSDSSKLNATLSNWSIHSEALDEFAAKQLYSNGHVRNAKNLPSINSANVKAFWQLNDTVNPENDLSGNNYHLQYQDGGSNTLISQQVNADGATAIVEEDQYGSGITMSITKRFDVINNQWTNVHTHPTCICLSFNGFEDQAEYFAIYNPDALDVADNLWHHTSLSFSGKEGSSTNNTVNLCFDSTAHNFVLSIDGNNYTTAHFVGGLGGPITNKCFPAEERHLKFVINDQEDYMPHAQLNSNIFESINQTTQKFEPVVAKNYKTSFIGYTDESSFHSESWFTDETGTPTTSFNDQKTATLYGSTSTLSNRGINSTIFTQGKPYPLRRPSVIGASTSTGNQYIDPNKYNASTNADGGLEAWWRWGDTVGDCSENINDAVGFESDPIDGHRSLKARNYISEQVDTDNDGIPDTARDIIILTETDSIYVVEGSTSPGAGECTSVEYLPAILENIQAGICNIKNLTLPVLQYIRIKFTNSGEAQLGKDKVEASIHYRKRR